MDSKVTSKQFIILSGRPQTEPLRPELTGTRRSRQAGEKRRTLGRFPDQTLLPLEEGLEVALAAFADRRTAAAEKPPPRGPRYTGPTSAAERAEALGGTAGAPGSLGRGSERGSGAAIPRGRRGPGGAPRLDADTRENLEGSKWRRTSASGFRPALSVRGGASGAQGSGRSAMEMGSNGGGGCLRPTGRHAVGPGSRAGFSNRPGPEGRTRAGGPSGALGTELEAGRTRRAGLASWLSRGGVVRGGVRAQALCTDCGKLIKGLSTGLSRDFFSPMQRCAHVRKGGHQEGVTAS
ncbi:collagen alpha-2(VIII) chain-like [Equus przewalskii]|uniref:Collagen alpha-2(VIII) chain-like n=1 Tax=Equus przewalskii TaxID=9798 RepID=A0ABM4PZU3_EQUPR